MHEHFDATQRIIKEFKSTSVKNHSGPEIPSVVTVKAKFSSKPLRSLCRKRIAPKLIWTFNVVSNDILYVCDRLHFIYNFNLDVQCSV